jgi:hypothetical protein
MKKNYLTTFIKLSSLTLVLLSASGYHLYAQSGHQTARMMGLGGGGAAYQDLYHANFVNPANLMINHEKRPTITAGLAGGIYARAGGSLLNISIYNAYLTSGLVIEGEVADNMLDQWFGVSSSNMRSGSMDAGAVTLGGVYRSDRWVISAAHRYRVIAGGSFSRGVADLVFRGLDSDYFSDPRTINTRQEVMAYNEVSVGFAASIYSGQDLFGFTDGFRIYAGIAPKLLLGGDYASLSMNSTLRVQGVSATEGGSINHNFSYTLEAAGDFSDQLAAYNRDRIAGSDPKLNDYVDYSAGNLAGINGISAGVDLGVTAELDLKENLFGGFGIFRGEKKLRLGLSLTDLGSVSFSDRARSFSASDDFYWDGFQYDQATIDEQFDGDESAYFESVLIDSIGNDIYGNFSTVDQSRQSVGLPSQLRFGSHLELGRFGLMLDLGAGFVERGSNSKKIYLALGSEYRFWNRVPLRAGFRTGGENSTTYHAGTGIEFRNIDFTIGAATTASSKKSGATIAAAWSGIVVHF